jgi:acyl-CoA thioesterase I
VPDGTDGVIVELGANDMLRGISPAVTRKALDAILQRLKERGMPVLLCGMYAAPNLGPEYQREFKAIYPDLARRYGAALYPFFLQDVAGKAEFNQRDGVHPTAAGVEAIVRGILPTAEEFVRKIAQHRG